MNWHKGNVSNSHKKFGANHKGMYSELPKKVLTDTPEVGEAKKEAIVDYLKKYVSDNGKMPTYTHMNKRFSNNGTAKYYKSLLQ